MCTEYVAHVRKNGDDTWAPPHLLSTHLENTAQLARTFAAKFNSSEWGKAAGLAHDIGKGRTVWQNYIRQSSGYEADANSERKTGKVPHAIHGANLVEELFGKYIGRPLAYCIAGHHSGLPDWSNSSGTGQAALEFQQTQVKDLTDIADFATRMVHASKPGNLPWNFDKGLDLSLWIRMLYSCLVDADYLDTESYMNEAQASERGGKCTMAQLLDRFKRFAKHIDETASDTEVNKKRRDIRAKCIEKATGPQGIYSLSVPTGGGKTLSSLAFSLEHAVKHNLDRIIYVIPYTSIIEQNADVFRRAVGSDQVVEHHSNLDDDGTLKSRLAAENWDAPVIVTTSVQFYESLFSSKPGRCRKLHNIAKSVVVLDEAQLVPVKYLAPILETMQLLVDHYHVTFVISTATQPAFGERRVNHSKFPVLKNVIEIMGDAGDVQALYESLRRVTLYLPEDYNETESWEEIAEALKQHDQVLCVVSDRKSCRELHGLMPKGTFHLSALMCGQHRSETIENIKQKLKNGEPVRVISTQLVEAGVDLDFPVVYRALAGLDSIAQVAGRCNREGKLPEPGKVFVFIPPKQAPPGILRKAADTARNILAAGCDDPLGYNIFTKYFAELYWKANSLDAKDIIQILTPDRQELGISFRTAAERFRLIDDSLEKSIIVRYGESNKLLDTLRHNGPDRKLLRKLQRYTVNVYNHDFNELLRRGSIEEIYPKIFALTSEIEYSKDFGLIISPILYDPEDLII